MIKSDNISEILDEINFLRFFLKLFPTNKSKTV